MKINGVFVASVIYFIILLIIMVLAVQMQAKTSLKFNRKSSERLNDKNVDLVEILYINISF